MGEVTEGKFFIRSGSEEFQNRQTGVFNKLNLLEEIHCVAVSEWKNDDVPDDAADDIESGGINRSKNESNPVCEPFKVPTGVPPKRLRPSPSDSCPGYRAQPEKWTKYTLSDVTEASLSEDANSEAAMDFLASRWKACSDYEDATGKVDRDDQDSENASNPKMFEFGKLRMPEYTVGKSMGKQSRPSSKRSKDSDANKTGTNQGDPPKVKLSFLNSISHAQKEDVTDSCGGDGNAVAKDGNPTEYVDNVVSESAEPSTPLEAAGTGINNSNSTTFRSVRKRKRNIRQATSTGEECDTDD